MNEVVVVQPQQYAVTTQPLQYSVVVQLPGPQGPAGGDGGGGSSWALDLLNANGLALSGANALSLALVSSDSPGAMSIADKTILDSATDANTDNALVRRDLAGRFATTRITMPAGSGNGLIIGSVNIYEQTGGFIRVGGSLTVDGSFNGSGSGLTSIPNSSVVGLGTGALKNADNSANNLPVLDSSGLLASSCFPPLVVIDTNVVNSQAAMLAITAQKGDIAIRTDNGKTYILSTNSPTTLADWKEITAAGVVTTVNGQTGVVVLTTASVTENGNLYYTTARALADCPPVTIGTANGLSLIGQVLSLSGIPESAVTNLTTDLSAKANLAGATFTGKVVNAFIPLAYAATLNTDAALGNTFSVGLTGDMILAAPTNPTNGQIITWEMFQGAGPWTLTLSASFVVPAGQVLTLNPAVGSMSALTALYSTGDFKWHILSFTGLIRSTTVVAAYAASYTTDATLSNSFFMTLAGPLTLANPTGGVDGQEIDWFLKQDGTGGRVLTVGSAFRVPGSGGVATFLQLSLTANAVDVMRIRYSSADGKWEVLSFTNENTLRPVQDIRFTFQKSDNSVLTAAASEAEKVWGKIDYDCDILSVNLEADAVGSVVLELEVGVNVGLTVNITATAKPTLSSAQTMTDAVLTGWTKFIAAGSTVKAYVSGTPATIKKITMTIKYRRR